jgi:hypothetical protein
VQGLAFLGAASLVLVAWGLSVDRQGKGEKPLDRSYQFGPTPGADLQKEQSAWTDQGEPIRVFGSGVCKTLPEDEAAEAAMVQAQQRELRMIRTAAPYRGSNCHGWVFTGGRYAVDGGEVERILAGNGYQVVSAPQVGDLIIYRGETGTIAHSGVVRVVDRDLVLVEDKWGHLGRYLHTPEDYSFASSWSYYRSPRNNGHILRGLEPEKEAPGGTPVATLLLKGS